NRVVAFIRYVPDPEGNRERDGTRYSKFYALSKRYELLKRDYPKYLVNDPIFNTLLCEVPFEDVKRHYQPARGLQDLRNRKNLDDVETTALQFMEILKDNAGVPWSKLGVSGSILVGLHMPSSDIDLIVYGSETGYRVQAAMKEMLEDKNSPIKAYDLEGLKGLFDFRSKDTITSFEDFVRTDSRKVSHGKFRGRDFFIRFVKDLNEISEQYGSIIYKPEGRARIKATVVDDSESIFTPCSYKVANVKNIEGTKVEPIEEIVSFRGRFCEQARSGETVIAEGKVERVQSEGAREHFRLLLGSKPADHMILVQ
ncbi:nucleotidyltransferase domain-containing protein, partial [Candidatus Bathyarchaeota archaeon]|nr:nucleotidyltransferase domain-containing protein [Candidatus Bathyarchaeota archaeon]